MKKEEKRKILFIGPPGSGKGTQAKLLKKYGLVQIGVGSIIRKSLLRKNPIVLPYKNTIQQGKLIPDKITLKIIEKETKSLPKNSKGYVLDGGGRTLFQAKRLVKQQLISKVVYFKLSQKLATERLLKRAKISRVESRKDDNPKSIKERFEEFNERTKPALAHLRKSIKFITIDASPSVEKIHKEIVRELGL